MRANAAAASTQEGNATLDVMTAVVLIVSAVALVVLYALGHDPPPPVPRTPIVIADRPSKGEQESPLVLAEWSDFECPYCRRFATGVLPVLQRYIDQGSMQLVFNHLPLAMHANAELAAVHAECAGEQGEFWALHDQVFGSAADLTPELLQTFVDSLDLDMDAFNMCLTRGPARERVEEDERVAAELGFTGTPSFVLGRRLADGRIKPVRVFEGLAPPEEFSAAIDSELRWGWLGPIRRVAPVYLVATGSAAVAVLAIGAVLIVRRRRQ